MKKKIYISGPITGVENYEKAFEAAAEQLKEEYNVVNPVKVNDLVDFELSYSEYMMIDLALLGLCDYIYMLKGWEHSNGAMLERLYAEKMKIKVLYEEK